MTLVAMSLFVGACSPSNTESTAIGTTSTPSTETTMEGAVELVVSDQQLTSGTYTRSDFTPRVTFEVSGGEWYAVQAAAGFFDIQQDVGSPHVIAVQFGNVEAAYGGDDERVEPASAAEAVTIVGSHAQLTVLAQDSSRTAGLEGTVVVVENTSQTQARILDVPAGPLAIDPGRRLWAALFDVGDGILAVMVGGSAERWDEALLAAEPILETVTIDPERLQVTHSSTRIVRSKEEGNRTRTLEYLASYAISLMYDDAQLSSRCCRGSRRPGVGRTAWC